jgi:hypothetical protein
MALNEFQYEALFTNAFGSSPADMGVTIDASGPDAVGKAGPNTIELLVIGGRALEWRVNGETLQPWEKVFDKKDPSRQRNGDLLRAKLG